MRRPVELTLASSDGHSGDRTREPAGYENDIQRMGRRMWVIGHGKCRCDREDGRAPPT